MFESEEQILCYYQRSFIVNVDKFSFIGGWIGRVEVSLKKTYCDVVAGAA